MEEKGKPEEAIRLFQQGWNESINDFEPWHESRFAGWQVGVELLNKVN